MKTDIEIAQNNKMKPIAEIAAALDLDAGAYDSYGSYKAKITLKKLRELQSSPKKGKLILVTAITPTPAGEGKSTVSIALADGLRRAGKRSAAALREPSLGPCFGIKGGACGGGYAQIVPMEDINLHFTGDIHAVSAATNLIAAVIDNHLHHGNAIGIDPREIYWKRCVDLNDRALRNVVVGLGGSANGVPRENSFCIAVASEVMAALCLSRSIGELKRRLNRVVIARGYDKRFITLEELGVSGAAAALLKDAIRPNLVQTLEKTPAFVHGGPFANIAHGCSSVNATECALALADYVVTEAGFAADLGAEKFIDIKCRAAGLRPSCAVIVASARALKMHGGCSKQRLNVHDAEALSRGCANLRAHIQNMRRFGIPLLVAVNRFSSDSQAELDVIARECENAETPCAVCEGWEKGGAGAEDLAREAAALCETADPAKFSFLYPDEAPLVQKIETLATKIYRASSVEFSSRAQKKLAAFTDAGYGSLPICMAKTQNSISHDPTLVGAPSGYVFPVQDVQLYAGAGFVVPLAGDIMTMPGLPAVPAANSIDVNDDGVISGLF